MQGYGVGEYIQSVEPLLKGNLEMAKDSGLW
jgi:hypothetical protein